LGIGKDARLEPGNRAVEILVIGRRLIPTVALEFEASVCDGIRVLKFEWNAFFDDRVVGGVEREAASG
jgi:hypothetical protein